ncbi:MAG: hypothetical protein RIF32_22095 [Leptospirales bacterium]|jgi:hypothetical protein
MLRAGKYSTVALIVVIGGLVVRAQLDPNSARPTVSSIIESDSEAEILELRVQVQSELDQVEALLDAAAAAARPQAAETAASQRQSSKQADPPEETGPLTFAAPAVPAWFELAEYDSVQDQRLAQFRDASVPPAVLAAAPVLPASQSFATNGQGAVGCFSALAVASPPVVTRSFRGLLPAPAAIDYHSAASITLLQLSYHALRNGYHGGQGITHPVLTLSARLRPSSASRPVRVSRDLSPTHSISFSIYFFPKAAAFELPVTVQKRAARDSHTHIGDVA